MNHHKLTDDFLAVLLFPVLVLTTWSARAAHTETGSFAVSPEPIQMNGVG